MEKLESRKNPKVSHMKRIGSDRSYREECREFMCDGEKLLNEAVIWGADIITVFISGEVNIDIPETAQVYNVPEEIIDYVSPLKNAQKVVFSCRMPGHNEEINVNGRHILLENLQDPGNVGTVIRTAGAFDIDTVMLMGSCADKYNPKTIRSTMGAIFRQKIVNVDKNIILELKNKGLRFLGAALDTESCLISDVLLDNSVVCIGSEGSGLTDDMLKLCDKKVIIPMNKKCESLNAAVAASIAMWEMYRR